MGYETISIGLVIAKPVLLHGLTHLLSELGPHFSIVASDLDQLEDAAPSVTIVDRLAAGDDLHVIERIRSVLPSTGVMLVVPNERREEILRALRLGVADYCLEDLTVDLWRQRIVLVSLGDHPINDLVLERSDIASEVLTQFLNLLPVPTYSRLSSREVEILRYAASGKTNKEIARILNISNQTVKNHITSILRKLSKNDRTGAVVWAIRNGLLPVESLP